MSDGPFVETLALTPEQEDALVAHCEAEPQRIIRAFPRTDWWAGASPEADNDLAPV